MDILRIACEQVEIDDDNNETNSAEYTLTHEFTVSRKKVFAMASGSGWQSVSMDDLSDAGLIKVVSDKEIDVELNNVDTVLTELKSLIYQGYISQIRIRNNSGESAEIKLELYK